MTGAEIAGLVLGIIDAAMQIAAALTKTIDPGEALTARARIADGIRRRADRVAADELADLDAVPR